VQNVLSAEKKKLWEEIHTQIWNNVGISKNGNRTGELQSYDKFYCIKLSLHSTNDSCILQLVTPATCFGLAWPSSGLQRLVSIKVHYVAVPMRFNWFTLSLCLIPKLINPLTPNDPYS